MNNKYHQLLLLVIFLLGCNTKEDVTPKSNDNSIHSFEIIIDNNFIKADIDSVNHAISVFLPNGTSLTDLKAKVEINKVATISPDPTEVKDYSKPIAFKVAAEDGTVQDYIVNVIADGVLGQKNQNAQGYYNTKNTFITKTAIWDNSLFNKTTITFYATENVDCVGRSSISTPFRLNLDELKVGKHTRQPVFISYKTETGSSSNTFYNGQVEIFEITESYIKGFVIGGYLSEGEYIEGYFTAKFCK